MGGLFGVVLATTYADLEHVCLMLSQLYLVRKECVLSSSAMLYVLQMEQMQLQGKKGRSLYNSSSTAGRRGSSNTPPGQLQGAAGSMAMGLSSSGYAFMSSSGLGPGSLDGAGGPQLLGVGGGWSQRR